MEEDSALREFISATKRYAREISQQGYMSTNALAKIIKDSLLEEIKFGEGELEAIINQADGAENIQPSPPKARDATYDALVRHLFDAFRDEEREYFLGLAQEDWPRLGFKGGEDAEIAQPQWTLAAQIRFYMEMLLVLKGIKPCVLFMYNTPKASRRAFNGLIIDCLGPLVDRAELKSYGFALKYTAHNGHWYFVDTLSPMWPDVQGLFQAQAAAADQLQVGLALGYPLLRDGYETGCPVHFNDRTEVRMLRENPRGSQSIRRVIVLSFRCAAGDPADYQAVLDYYHRCRDAAASVGSELVMSLEQHPQMQAWMTATSST